jgi:hypothetical protein
VESHFELPVVSIMDDLALRIRDANGRTDNTETPDGLLVSEFLKTFLPRTGHSLADENGNAVPWILVDGGGRTLDSAKSFLSGRLPSVGHSEFLSPRTQSAHPLSKITHYQATS